MGSYGEMLPAVVDATRRAGKSLLRQYDPDSRPADRAAMFQIGTAIEDSALSVLKEVLDDAHPGIGWFDEDRDGVDVPSGEWWIVDGVEGAVNFVHGLPEWGLIITLVSDGVPKLAVVSRPVDDVIYTAVEGEGAYRDGRALSVSRKTGLDAAIATASQAGNSPRVHERFGRAFAVMSDRAMLVRNTVPTMFPMLDVAAGHYDLFWQYDPDLPGTVAGTLLATEAGAVVSTVSGAPWRIDSTDVLVAAPGVHAAALEALAEVGQ
ncbi:inositol monophosphatase family protein [Nocardia alni]|uniref:inositol monophosphatase family protein n=1 Tax=Nocardia alni TaxID=2815723 RepID=UPI001C2319E8|nr:inositol monophosphatase family protein [Nocardia alni]